MKDIKGFEGIYTIDMDGTIVAVKTGKVKKAGYDKYDCLRVSLYDADGKLYSRLVHRLVAEAFIPNPDGLPMVRMKDKNKSHVHASNLYWAANTQKVVWDG